MRGKPNEAGILLLVYVDGVMSITDGHMSDIPSSVDQIPKQGRNLLRELNAIEDRAPQIEELQTEAIDSRGLLFDIPMAQTCFKNHKDGRFGNASLPRELAEAQPGFGSCQRFQEAETFFQRGDAVLTGFSSCSARVDAPACLPIYFHGHSYKLYLIGRTAVDRATRLVEG
jgi:hypothetical protein